MAENEDIECACSTSDLGEPPGKLLGYRGNVLLVNGSLGDNLLTFPVQTLSRHDNGAVFRCVVLTDWAEAAEQEVVTNLSVRVACELCPESLALLNKLLQVFVVLMRRKLHTGSGYRWLFCYNYACQSFPRDNTLA